jgi:putative tryptophan/tyrosine transport system substrate-binding protein
MKKGLLICLALLLAVALIGGPTVAQAKKFKIGSTKIVAHPALDADEKGFAKALADAGVEAEFDYQNAQGEMSNALAIAQKFKNDSSIDLVHAIATPTAQAACKTVKAKPVVFSSVTDPVDAGLVKTMEPAGGNVTGVSDLWPYPRQIALHKEMVPKAKKWGIIYNAGDANSAAVMVWVKKLLKEADLTLVEVTVAASSDVYTAAQSLVGRIDLMFIISDNTAVSAFESIVKVCNKNKIPLFGGGTESVERGATAALGYDYFQVGYSAGKKAAQILKGEKKAGEIASTRPENTKLVINLKAAKAQGVTISEKFTKMAEKVIK